MNMDDLFLRIYGDPVLRQRSEKIEAFGPDLEELAERMFEVMYEEEGVGLAAPQVGVSQRMMVLDVPIDDEENFTGVVINPEIVEKEGVQVGEEGCLSIPGLRDEVSRDNYLRVRAQNLKGEFFEFECTDLLSRAIQHEIDHLNGVLFVDRLSPVRRRLLAKRLKQMAAENPQKTTV